MGIEIYWTDFAKSELRKIFDYHKEKAGSKIAKQISKDIIKKADSVSTFPKIGVVEEFLRERPQEFRYIVSTNYKIIYWINSKEKRIEISDVFDTRQNPEKLQRNV